MDIKKKKFKNVLLKFENIEIIYISPTNQYWGISMEGVKKCIVKKVIDRKIFEDFLKKKKIISYENSKLFKKGVKFNFVLKGIELILNNRSIIIENLNKKIKCLGFTKKKLRCKNLVLEGYCYKHENSILSKNLNNTFTFVDLFCGMGSFHFVLKKFGGKCVLAIDNNINCNKIYYKNFNIKSEGDILKLNINSIPTHDILCAGFPCQPFSIAGLQKGFLDKRSNVIFKIFEILKKKKPRFIILENVKGLLKHNNGESFLTICNNLKKESYFVKFKVLNTKIITTIPQNRERLFIIAFRNYIDYCNFNFDFDIKKLFKLNNFLDSDIPKKYYYTKDSKIYNILKKTVVKSINSNTVYQYRRGLVRQNKNKVCPTLTFTMGSGGHNVPIILDNIGIRKLTPNECLKLQGFNGYDISNFSDSSVYKLCGNSITIDILDLIFKKLLKYE